MDSRKKFANTLTNALRADLSEYTPEEVANGEHLLPPNAGAEHG